MRRCLTSDLICLPWPPLALVARPAAPQCRLLAQKGARGPKVGPVCAPAPLRPDICLAQWGLLVGANGSRRRGPQSENVFRLHLRAHKCFIVIVIVIIIVIIFI